MNLLNVIREYRDSSRPAMVNSHYKITYKELWERSDALAAYLKQQYGSSRRPVVVYGHKHPLMLVAFLGCVKSGRAYAPIDITIPRNRAETIIDTVKPEVILTTEDFEPYEDYPILPMQTADYVSGITAEITEADYVKDEDDFYIIFTSGSTGKPKGVRIPYRALNSFLDWSLGIGSRSKQRKRFLNQTPFSFDVSVMDTYGALATESCIVALEKDVQSDYWKLFDRLGNSQVNVLVSTPSFAKMCLANPMFSLYMMPQLEMIVLCGEVLPMETAQALKERFPNTEIYNSYGPTETTVIMTQILITDEVFRQYDLLPVGYVKPGITVRIMDGMQEMPEGEKGEIVIIGDVVANGYLNDPARTEKSFFQYPIQGVLTPAYRSGDRGWLQGNLLFCSGRIDLQIKLHGYRIEPEDIEKNILKCPLISSAVVSPIYEDGVVTALSACCVSAASEFSSEDIRAQLLSRLETLLPTYMIPQEILFVDALPKNVNGKVDRKAVSTLVQQNLGKKP